MNLNRLVLKSMKKNITQYYLYFFALIFSVTLSFSFITMQYNEATQSVLTGVLAVTGFKVATVILYFIITCFVLYANHLFMKRRTQELGLYQLIGMHKSLVVRIIAVENSLLFAGAVSIGIALGFLVSRLFGMILLFIVKETVVVQLTFSGEALKQTLVMFMLLLMIVIVQTAWIIYRSTLLHLFTATKQADEKITSFKISHMLLGIVGVLLIGYGYQKSTVLFSGTQSGDTLFRNMVVILATTIGGTYLVFRYSVSLVMNMLRKHKKGFLTIKDVMAVTPVMHRMKENARSLTIITTLTGLSVGILSLSYISYYSAEVNAKNTSPYPYTLMNDDTIFLQQLEKQNIPYRNDKYHVKLVDIDLTSVIENEDATSTYVLPLSDYQQFAPKKQLASNESMLIGMSNFLQGALTVNEHTPFQLANTTLTITEVNDDFAISQSLVAQSPILVVPDQLFEKLDVPLAHVQQGITLINDTDEPVAERLFATITTGREYYVGENNKRTLKIQSQHQIITQRIGEFGIIIFITAFLGLALLITTGSILYFKQMAEAEDEKTMYTTLRKIGFDTTDMMKGIYLKQLYNFGVPLLIGLLHSFFAVKSGWFFFGTELVAPLLITITVYTVLYILFAGLTIQYYRRVIKQSL